MLAVFCIRAECRVRHSTHFDKAPAMSDTPGPTIGRRLSPSLKGHLLVLAGSVCISFAGFFVKDATIDVSMVAFYRLLFGTITLFAIAFLRGEKVTAPPKVLKVVWLAGFLFCCDLLSWHASIVYLGRGIATILANFQVFLLALYGVFFLKERLTRLQKTAMPLALFGLTLLLGLHDAGLPKHIAKGAALCLMSAVFYAAYILVLRRSQSTTIKLGPVTNMAWVSISACVFVGVFCVGTGVSFEIPDLRTVFILAALGILCQSLGWLLLSMGLPYLAPFRAGLIMLAQPALAFLWDMLIYGTVTGPINIFGAALAIAAIGMGILSKPKAPSGVTQEQVLQTSLHPAGESGRFRRAPDE